MKLVTSELNEFGYTVAPPRWETTPVEEMKYRVKESIVDLYVRIGHKVANRIDRMVTK